MEQTFEDYLKQARKDFAKVASEYTVTEHLKLRTAIDSLLIAYDQAVNKALTIPVVVVPKGTLCECGGTERVALDCTMKPCKHPKYYKGQHNALQRKGYDQLRFNNTKFNKNERT